jgi:hypothetical protein
MQLMLARVSLIVVPPGTLVAAVYPFSGAFRSFTSG